ncbi:hypothetical protein CQW23_24633 [Capsicum baccatum]|uniref:Pectinesterase inhibitor domain-containing protein n=1 Tax=Capsicum baccatum TaxID=33114 RepID=A0A2G2VVG8_CAPBA|nr:hypothetical protein CQW23_24633 [Capsicum baccatum]
MAFYNQVFLVIAIFLFLTTLPSKAYNIPKSNTPSPSPSKSSPSQSSSSSYKKTIEIPKRTPIDSNGNVSIFINSAMDATMAKTQEFITNKIEQRLKDSKKGTYATDCLKTCKEVYELAVDAMKKTEEDVKAKYYNTAHVDLSAMMTFIDTCNDCALSIYGDNSEFKEFNNWISGVGGDCITKILPLTK